MGDWADVLIVEDEKRLRGFALEILGMEGVSAAAAADGCEAMAYFERVLEANGQMPSILLMDLTMPCLSGYEVYEQIASAPWISTVTVIITSAMGDRFDPLPRRYAAADQTLRCQRPDVHAASSRARLVHRRFVAYPRGSHKSVVKCGRITDAPLRRNGVAI